MQLEGQNINAEAIERRFAALNHRHIRVKVSDLFERLQAARKVAQNATIDLAQLQREVDSYKRPPKQLVAAVERATEEMHARLDEVEALRKQYLAA